MSCQPIDVPAAGSSNIAKMRCRLCGSTPGRFISNRIRFMHDATSKVHTTLHHQKTPTRSLALSSNPVHCNAQPSRSRTDVSNHETFKPPVLSSRQITVQRYLLRNKPICCRLRLFRGCPARNISPWSAFANPARHQSKLSCPLHWGRKGRRSPRIRLMLRLSMLANHQMLES